MIKAQFTQESDYFETMKDKITPFWNSRQDGFLVGENNIRLYWTSFTKKTHKKAIMIVNGRIESVHKYQELFYDLFNQGYDIYSYDHRGQGLSDRLTTNRDIGHIDDFNHYIIDLKTITEQLIPTGTYQNCYLLGHSMGGAISTSYIAIYQHPYTALALSAPMFGINIPFWIKPFANRISHYFSLRTSEPTYAMGQKRYYQKPFHNNLLTNSDLRYQWFKDLYQANPDIQIGGASYHWVNQGLKGAKQSIQLAKQCSIPILILQGIKDRVIDNSAHQQFKNKAPSCQLIKIENAKHEVLFESDEPRNRALNALLRFYNKHT